MKKSLISSSGRACLLAAVAILGALPAAKAAESAWTNLVSDIPGVARYPDANLTDPVGVAALPGGTLIATDNGTGLLSVYNATDILGVSKFAAPESITIPSIVVGGTSAPTGVVFNRKAYALGSATTSFVIAVGSGSAASQALVATDEGTVAGVSLSDTAAAVAYTGAGAVYKGLALSGTGGGDGQQLYLANFKHGSVDVLNESFQPVLLSPTTANTFSSNPATQAGDMPFNVKAFSLKSGTATFRYLFVTYARPDPSSNGLDDLRGAAAEGDGYVLAFDPAGNFKGVIATSGTTLAVSGTGARTVSTGTAASVVSSPWGMALLHSGDGGTLFVGNVADGTIQTFRLAVADAEGDIASTPGGPLVDVEGDSFQIENLWGLQFGADQTWTAYILDRDELVEDAGSLYFCAGIAGETHGLLGRITSREVAPLPAHFRFDPVTFK